MRLLAGSGKQGGPLGPSAVAIGIFDGVHKGHQALLQAAKELAAQDGCESLAYSFHPHPASIMAPDLAPKLIEPTECRIERLEHFGIGTALIERFDREFASITAEEFVRELLVGKLQARHVIIGEGFSFGHQQKGDVALLSRLGDELGFRTHPVKPVKVEGMVVSSTKIREFVAMGQMRGAAMLLGRPYELRGLVTRGVGRGSRIGTPTANVTPHNELVPGGGVYAAWLSGNFTKGRLQAVVNIGFTPTFGSLSQKLEAHILDFAPRPLYGHVVSLEFVVRLRDEQRFRDAVELAAQIQKDIAQAREVLATAAQSGDVPEF
jgi:riboflavin kinase/FMN adenylyltransferase